MDDSRARFLTAISQRLGADRIVELHLFSPIRQGLLETGVAVVAATPGDEEEGSSVWEGNGKGIAHEAAAAPSDAAAAAASVGDTAPSAPSHARLPSTFRDDVGRLVVYTARYRLTRKGPDRGKWLFECAATADAPLPTVDAVARGVTLRAKDLTDSERFSGKQLQQLLEDPACRTPA